MYWKWFRSPARGRLGLRGRAQHLMWCGLASARLGTSPLEIVMREVVIVSSVRTPVGRAFKGTLRATRPDELAAIAIKGALERVPQVDPKEIEDVILGCAMPEAGARDERCPHRRAAGRVAGRGFGDHHQSLLLFRIAGDCHGGGAHHERRRGDHRGRREWNRCP